jgi:uncharacterized glyoxalase superfamily protein PhnB
MSEVRQTPVTAYLTVKGARDAIKLYKRAFGAAQPNGKTKMAKKRKPTKGKKGKRS